MIWPLTSLVVAASLTAAPVEPTATAAPVRRRFALTIGSNDGIPSRPLRHAVSDAQAMAAVLQQLGGITRTDASVLIDPTAEEVRRTVEALGRRVRESASPGTDAELVFYFSGHSDEQGVWLKGERVDYPRLRAQLREVPVQFRVVILDSCGSGAFTRAKGGSRVPAFLTDASTTVTGEAVLTSSAVAEVAQESDRIGASFFTHHLVSALRGAGDVNRDGKVTLDEAYQHAFEGTLARTERTASGVQHPGYEMAFSGAGAVVMTDLRTTTSLLSFAAQLQGRVFIRTSEGKLVVELDKRAGTPMELGLEQGRYQVTVVDGGRWLGGEVLVRPGQAAVVEPTGLHPIPAEENLVRGEADAGARTWRGELRMGPEYVVVATRVGEPLAGSSAVGEVGPFVASNLAARVFLSGFRADPGLHLDASEFLRHPDTLSVDTMTELTLKARVFPLPSTGLLIRTGTQAFNSVNLGVGLTQYLLPSWEVTAGFESNYTTQVALGTATFMRSGWFASTSALVFERWKASLEANGPVLTQNPFWLPEGQMRGVEPLNGLNLALRNAFYVTPRLALDLDVAAAMVVIESSLPLTSTPYTWTATSLTGTVGGRWTFHDAWTVGLRTSVFYVARDGVAGSSDHVTAVGLTTGIDVRWRF